MDIIEKFAKNIFPLKFPCPAFPPLQFRISPIVEIKSCSILRSIKDNNNPISILEFDNNCGAIIGINFEGGIYFDIKVASLSLSAGVEGHLFEGKIGMKFSVDFTQIKIILSIYMDLFSVEFIFYVKLTYKILFIKGTLFNFNYPFKFGGLFIESYLIFDLKRFISNNLPESYYFE